MEKQNKTILITGASSGLGKLTAELFAKKGWTVIATMRNLQKAGSLVGVPNVQLLELDLDQPEQFERIIEKTEQISPVDVLFNNAGYVLAGPLEALLSGFQ